MKTLSNFVVCNKKIILRADLNVPVVNDKITDYTRIETIAPSIIELIKNKNKIFILAHFGRPEGREKKFSLKFLCKELKQKFDLNRIHFLETFNSLAIEQKLSEMQDGEVCLFENIRFEDGEEKNDLSFSKNLSYNFDIYINDAFSASHRAHASIVGITNYLPSLAGLSFINEVSKLQFFLNDPKKPNLAIIGGSKISTKIKVINNLVNLFDSIVIGGAMANTFLLSNNIEIGKSLCELDCVNIAKQIQINAKNKNCNIILPVDVVCSKNIEHKNDILKCNVNDIPTNEMILDVGEGTVALISKEILKSKSVLWNGPLGAFEFKPFDKSSIEIANTIKKYFKEKNIETLDGGGDTLSAINLARARDGFNHLSTAGGAFLEWLEGDKSPGFKSLEKNNL